MKKYFIIALLLLVLPMYSQDSQNFKWATYQLDSIVSIKLPGEVFQMDTILHNKRVHGLFSTRHNANFISQILFVEKTDKDLNISQLPYDNESLEKFYDETAEGMSSKYTDKLFSKEYVTIDSIKACQLVFKDTLNISTNETLFFLINNRVYTISYMNFEDFNTTEKDTFLNSVTIHKNKDLSQYIGTPQGERIATLLGELSAYLFLIVGFIVFLRYQQKKNKKIKGKTIK